MRRTMGAQRFSIRSGGTVRMVWVMSALTGLGCAHSHSERIDQDDRSIHLGAMREPQNTSVDEARRSAEHVERMQKDLDRIAASDIRGTASIMIIDPMGNVISIAGADDARGRED